MKIYIPDNVKIILESLKNAGFEAYCVGGAVRDSIMGVTPGDWDITTSALPEETRELFKDFRTVDTGLKHGTLTVIIDRTPYEVTTFRIDGEYGDNRHPENVTFTSKIGDDLARRDFTVNTLCMNSRGEVLDILNIKKDIDQKILRTVGNPRYRIKEDSLRILRCIRFATILDFEIETKTKHFLSKYGYLLKNLSMNRKKEELDKIFSSKNKEIGRKLLIELNLTNALDINKLNNIVLCTDLLGIWCQLEVEDIYPFTKYEKSQIKLLRELLKYNKIDNYALYKYGLYLCTVYADIKGLSKRKLNTKYSELPITSRKDIEISGEEISQILGKTPGPYIKDIMEDLEKNILNSKLTNNYSELKEYIIKKYSN